jgi:Holliday junction resolvase
MRIDVTKFPLCSFFVSDYLSRRTDAANFPPDGGDKLLSRYEKIFESGISNFGLSEEKLKKRTEFNFDSGDPTSLEAGIAILRVAEVLRINGFKALELISPEKDKQGADITCEKNGIRVCIEVKTVTKQSCGVKGHFLEDQLYEKVRTFATKAAAQLKESANVLKCEITILAYVVNWFDHTILLTQEDLQEIVDKLEEHGEVRSIDGIDGVWFIMRFGNDHLFLNDSGKRIDVPANPQ